MAVRPPALSASRTKEYLQCPLKFRFQVVDGLVQPPSAAAVKGTVVHHALEKLFDLPPGERTPQAAHGLLPDAWQKTLERDEGAAKLFEEPRDQQAAEEDTRQMVDGYFQLERPQNLEPKGRERFVDVRLQSGVLLRGIIDRIDQAPSGALRVVDYKTGRAPDPRYTEDALFQMRFYALLLRESWRLPARLQLLYVKHAKVLTLDPAPGDIELFEQQLQGIWERIKGDALSGDFATRRSKLCDWCAFQDICPAFSGTPPQMPEEGRARLLAIEQPGDSPDSLISPSGTGETEPAT